MREIKFRAWDTKLKGWKGLWIFRGGHTGEYNVSKDKIDILDLTTQWGKEVILMQFTGLKDKNGIDIYEMDLLKYSYARDMSGKDIIEFTEVVEWENTTDIVGFGIHQTMDHKIIGNIYEHPELLNSEQEAERSVATKMPNEQ